MNAITESKILQFLAQTYAIPYNEVYSAYVKYSSFDLLVQALDQTKRNNVKLGVALQEIKENE